MMMGQAAASILATREGTQPGEARGFERFLRHAAPFARMKGPAVLAFLLALITIRSLLNPDVPWNTEIGPDGRRQVTGGVLVIPGMRMEDQEDRIAPFRTTEPALPPPAQQPPTIPATPSDR